MSGSDKVVVDTNLFIFLLNGNEKAAKALLDKQLYFSFITEIELLGNTITTAKQQALIKEVLSFHTKLGYNDEIGNRAIAIMQQKKIKVPDAIIAATALLHDLPLLTSDKTFGKVPDLECIVFEV